MRLRNKSITPPCQWRYIQRDTGYWFEEHSWHNLVEVVKKHRAYKGLPLDTVEHDIEQQLCMTLPDRDVDRQPEDPPQVVDRSRSLGVRELLSAGKALFQHLKDGAVWEDEEESRRRAAICETCPLNKNMAHCSCTEFYKIVQKLVPEDRQYDSLGVCAVCACSLNAKVNVTADVVRQSTDPSLSFPSWCWQRELTSSDSPDTIQ